MTTTPSLDLLVRTGCEISYRARFPAPIILTLRPGQGPRQMIESERLSITPRQGLHEYVDSHGNTIHRFKLNEGLNTVRYDALVWVPSARENKDGFGPALPVEQLPDDVLRYTLPSRYCDSDKLLDFAFDHFGQSEHGAVRVQAICDWLHHNIEYRMFCGSPNTTASDIIAQRFGVCRDFAHTAVALCRTFNLPARYISGYVPDIAYGAARWERFEVWSYQIDPAEGNASLDVPVDLSRRLCGTETLIIPGQEAAASVA